MTLRTIQAQELSELLSPSLAAAAVEHELGNGLDPEVAMPRTAASLGAGEFLLMPAESSRYAGIKVTTVAPANPSKGKPKIQGTYLLFDAATLTPLASIEGAELTLIRTSAVTAVAVKHMLAARNGVGTQRNRIEKLLVFGTSLQADRHIRAVTELCEVGEVIIVGHSPGSAQRLAAQWQTRGVDTRAGGHGDLATADVIVCATSSATPLFDGSAVGPRAIVAAIGAHGLGSREIDETLALRSDIVVEARAAAFRESGNLIPARTPEEWEKYQVANLQELVCGQLHPHQDRPLLYSAVGMAWQDLVLASKAFEAGG
jgi:1-piperideine-2-carboxylate/1-pyrroline-2-carboxylate reductase [NAD(P)H]